MIRYLLGLLPDEEAERLDEASIADDQVAARLRLVEHDLVDAYVRGNLDGETLRRFESYYSSSPRRRENIVFARKFLKAVDRAAVDDDAHAQRTAALVSFPPRSRLVPVLAAAAAILLIACAFLTIQSLRLERGLRTAQQERAAQQELARDLERQLAEAHAAKSAAPAAPPQPERRNPATFSSTAPAIALTLLPQTRAIGPVPALSLAPNADRVAFELRLESNDFTRYQVGLKDPASGAIGWRSDWMAPRTGDDHASITVVVPAGALKAQHYTFDVAGRRPDGRQEILGSYAFQVESR